MEGIKKEMNVFETLYEWRFILLFLVVLFGGFVPFMIWFIDSVNNDIVTEYEKLSCVELKEGLISMVEKKQFQTNGIMIKLYVTNCLEEKK